MTVWPDKEMMDFLKEIDDDKNGVKQDDRNTVTSGTVDIKHDKNAVKLDEKYAVKLDDNMTSVTVPSKDDKNAFKQYNDMRSDTVDSKDKSDSSARQDDRNAAKQDDEHESDQWAWFGEKANFARWVVPTISTRQNLNICIQIGLAKDKFDYSYLPSNHIMCLIIRCTVTL